MDVRCVFPYPKSLGVCLFFVVGVLSSCFGGCVFGSGSSTCASDSAWSDRKGLVWCLSPLPSLSVCVLLVVGHQMGRL